VEAFNEYMPLMKNMRRNDDAIITAIEASLRRFEGSLELF